MEVEDGQMDLVECEEKESGGESLRSMTGYIPRWSIRQRQMDITESRQEHILGGSAKEAGTSCRNFTTECWPLRMTMAAGSQDMLMKSD